MNSCAPRRISLSRFADLKYLRAPADGAPCTAEQKGRIVAESYEDGKRCARLAPARVHAAAVNRVAPGCAATEGRRGR